MSQLSGPEFAARVDDVVLDSRTKAELFIDYHAAAAAGEEASAESKKKQLEAAGGIDSTSLQLAGQILAGQTQWEEVGVLNDRV